MRVAFLSGPILLAFLTLAGCQKSGGPDHDTFAGTKSNQVVLKVDGLN